MSGHVTDRSPVRFRDQAHSAAGHMRTASRRTLSKAFVSRAGAPSRREHTGPPQAAAATMAYANLEVHGATRWFVSGRPDRVRDRRN